LNELYNMINIKASAKELKLIFDIDKGIPSEYYGDDFRIRQVLLNLLTNAVKYTAQGTVTLQLTVDRDGENAVLHYSVRDTGIGIKEEDLDRIFDQFERLEEARNRYIEGTGLGMNIAMQLLRLMGSELHVKSEYGKGSEFSFDITQEIRNETTLSDYKNSKTQEKNAQENKIYFTAPEATVLVVDDNSMNRKVFRHLLRHTQVTVCEASSGQECVDILSKQAVDIVFLDYMMPNMDGVETFHILKKNHLCDDTPIIMLTANAVVGAKEEYLNEGFDDYLAKPIMVDALEKMLLDYLPERKIIRGGND